MAGKGGGAWKVAYADFVTAMMAFFMVMWLLSQNDKVKNAVALHFRNPYGQYAVGDTLLPPKNQQYFKDRVRVAKGSSAPTPETNGLKTRRPYTLSLHRGDRTILGTYVTFAPDATELDEAACEQLKTFLPRILGKPQKVEIRGHAMRRVADPKTEQAADAWELSYHRCLSTMKFLIDQGIAAERVRLSQAGAFEPYTLGDQPDQLANNSRIEVYLLNEVAEDANGTPEERDERFKSHAEMSKVETEKPSAVERPQRAAGQMTSVESPAAHEDATHSSHSH